MSPLLRTSHCFLSLFFFNDTATTEIYTLSLHDALPISNNIVVPLEGAGENLKLTISSPIQVHGVAKVPAKRAPELGEHNDEVLKELGLDTKEIERLRASGVIASPTLPASKPTAVAA